MKTIKKILVCVGLISIVSCNTAKSAEDASWRAYCKAYGVNFYAPTEDEENYFLDCWLGSTEEEQALTL